MKRYIRLFYQKVIAIVVSVSFVITLVLPKNSFAVTNINSQSSFIPSSLGKVTSAKFYDSQELVINIQDLHCHAQTQRNITAILEYLDTEYNIDKIYLEGVYKDINTKWLSDLKKEQTGNKILESLIDTGRLSGTEYYSAISNKNEIIAGIEDENLYKENIKLLGEIISKRQEIEEICSELEQKISSIKKEYFKNNKEIKNFENLTTKYKNKQINSLQYYNALNKLALSNNINLKRYPNLISYLNILEINNSINKNKVTIELKQFLTELKSLINYQDYIQLLNESNSFKDITNISQKLLVLDNTYKISDKLKLKNLNYFLKYIELSKNINPIEFMDEEIRLTDIISSKLAKNKYEHEVIFLSYFLPKIKDYFLADITAQNYHKFNELFVKFKKILLSYSSADVVSKLDKYQDLLLKYYKNNMKRDEIFAKTIVKKKNETVKLSVGNTSDALKYITNNFKGKKIKLVVTGGFHTAGLEKTLENNRISYIVITPKVTENIDKAKEIYADIVKYNANILTNSINIEALSQESLKVSFPKILNNIFDLIKQDITLNNLNNADILTEINKFVDKHIKNINDNVKVLSWEITEGSPKDKNIKYSVTYLVQNGEKEETETIEYTYPFVRDSNEKVSENKFEEAVIFKDLFKSLGGKIELIYKTIIAPITENFVLFYIPFLASSALTVSPDLSAIPLAVTTIFGVIVFPLAHLIADYFDKDDNKKDEKRTFKKFLVPGILFSGTFIAFSLAFPGHSFIAFFASSVAHSIYNILVLKRIINIPLALIIDKLFKKDKVTKEDIDTIVTQGSVDRYLKVNSLYEKLPKKYPSNEDEKEVVLYIIEKLYELEALNNNGIIPDRLKPLFNNYDAIRDYFLTIGKCNKKDKKISNKVNKLYYDDLYLLTNNLKKITSINNSINNSNLTKLNGCIKEFDNLLELAKENEIYINEDVFPIVKMLLNDIIEVSYELAQKQKDKEVELLLNSILPLYNEVISFNEKIYRKRERDEYNIEIVKNIASKFIQQNKFEAFYTSFKFITIVYKTNENLMYKNDNNIELSVMELFLELVDDLNDNSVKFDSLIKDKKNYSIFDFLIKKLKNDGIILSNDDIKNIIKYYRFNSENTNFYEFIFDRIISNCDDFDIGEIFIYIYNSDGKHSVAALNLFLEKLYDFVTDERNDLAKRKKTSIYLGQIISFAYEKDEINTKNIDIDKVNSLYNEFGINACIFQHSVYLDGLFKEQDDTNFNNMFSFTPLFRKTDRNLLNHGKIKSKVVFYYISGENTGNNEIIKQFDAWKVLVNYNDISLERLNNIYFYSKNNEMDEETKEKIRTDFDFICANVEQMIDAFKDIDVDGNYVGSLEEALVNIKNNFHPLQVDEHIKTLGWEGYRSNLSEISSLNTLINAVHQLSAKQFIQNINKINTENKTVQKWYLQNDETKIVVNNLSDKAVNNEIWELIFELFKGSNISFEDIIVHNNELYCTCKLNAHSVGIYFNFSPNNKSINISFTESTTGEGNKLRIIYFKKVLESLGFKPGKMPFTIQVSMDETTGINSNTDFVKLTKKVLTLFRYSNALDLYFRYLVYDNRDINDTIDKFKEAFLNGFMWFNYMDDGSYHEFKDKAPASLYMSIEDKQRFENINSVLKNLNLKTIPQEIIDRGLITQEDIDEYINIQLERAFAEGRIFFDKNGFLSANSKINLTQEVTDFIKNNADVSIKQAELLSIIDNNKFNFRFVDMIGGLVLKSGYIKLANGNFLSVKVLMEPNGSEFKFAKVEEVKVGSGKIRKFLDEDYDTLRNILIENYYKVPERIEVISDMEKINRIKLLDEEFVRYDTPLILADGVSAGKGNYIPVKISYDKNKTDEKKVWVTPYTTVEDEKEIRKSGAIVTTTGGKISHASIVTNEFGIPAVNIPNGIWEGGKLYAETLVDDKIELRELKEGSTLLVNGETGHILIFDEIENKVLEKLQQYIDEDEQNINEIIKFIKTNEHNKNVNKLLEYMFFQLPEKSIIEILNSKNISNNVRDKLQTLITVNLKQVEQQIEETILNIKSTGNIIVKYMLVKELDKKIENISNINSGLIDKYTVYRKQVLSGVNKFVSTQLSAVDEMSNLAAATDSQKTEFLIQLRKIETLIPYLETNTENKNLEELKNKTITLKENILASIEQTNTTNIKSSEEKLTVEDFIKYGAKFINTAITSKILRENEKKLIKENIKVEIPSAYSIGEDFLMKLLGDKAKEYMELNKELDIAIQNKDYDNAKQISENIYSLIGNNITNKEKLNKILEKIDDKTIYAVRSSGLGEDEGNSFAGMGKTNLNVTKENIVESIVDSWQAFYLETPISYMISNRKRVKPCIMVQPFIVGEKSGVAFSSNKEGNSIISVGYGLGEGIVNSSVPADTIVANISNGEIIEYVNVNKKTQILPKENETGTGTEMKFVEDEIKAQSRALSNNEVKALMKVVKILEEEYGYPIDVEWTIKDGTIYILQVRPITILNVKEDEGQNISKAASLFDNLFSDKTTKFYKFWTIGVAPIIETLVFIVIPYFILFSTNPLGFATVAVIVFALSHLGTDIINKIIKPSAKLRSLADIRTIGMAGAFFAGVFLAVNLLLPGYSLIAFVASLIIHSIYNYISTKTDKLPAATLYNHETEKETEIEHKEWPISNEETFDIKEIYEDVGIERFLEEMKKWKEEVEYIGTDTGLKHKIAELADKLYSEQKYSDAADIIFMAYKLDLLKTIKDHDWKNIRNAGYDGTAFYYNSIAENYPQNEELEDAVKKNIKKLKSSGISGDFGKEIKKIRVRLENILEVGINDKNIPIIHELFQDYHEKINNYLLENGKSATSIDEAVILLKAVIPLYKEIIDQKFEFNDEIFESFKEIAMLVYPVDFDKEYDSRKKDFDEFVNFLTEYIVKTEKVTKNHYKLVVEIAKSVYKGISYHSDEIFDENKYREAVQRKKDTIDILKKFKDKSKIDYILFANDIFKDVILDETTLNLLFKSLKNTWYEYELELNEDDGLNDEIQNLIVNNCSNLDMGYMCHYFYFEHENAEGNSYFTESIIKKLMNIYDNSTNEELKESAAIALGEIYSVMYEYIDNKNIISIDELNNFYEQKDMNYVLIKNSSYMSNLYDYDSTVYGTRSFYKDVKDRLRDKKFSPTRIVDAGKDKLDYEFNITPLILKSNYNEDFEIKEKAPVFIKKYKVHSLEDREELSSLAEKFDALKALMENNSKAMLAMNREDFDDTFKYLKEMINCIRVINEDDADMCEKSLKKIKADVNQNNLTSKLNSLINTVHQTGIEDFRTIVRYKNINEDFDSFQNLLKAEHKGTEIRAYNLSEKETVNPEIYKMISNLALDKHNIDLFFKDDIVVWSIQLLAHSVDIIFDFGNKDRGIKIYYNESGSDLSNEWRIDYFNRVLKNNLNFGNPRNMDTDALNDDSHTLYVENDGYGIRVSLDNNTGLKDETDLVDIATKVIKLFEYSINLDHKFENVYNDITYDYLGDTDGKIRVEGKIEGFVDVFMKGEMPFNYNLYVSNIYSEAPLYMDKPGDSRIKKFKNYMNDILENLGLEQIPEDVLNEEIVYMPNGDEMRNGYGQADRNFFQNDIDKYFNKPIEQAYIEGRIIFNSEGKLVKNKNYNLTDSFINMFEDENTLVNVAEIIKTVPEYNKNYYSIEFAFGDLVTRTSEIKLNNRSIYIKELFDPLTNSIEYAQAELVTMSGREILTDKKLKKILTDEGYEITNIWTSGIEKANRKNKFKENILQKPEQLIDANVTSKGKNKHFIGEAVFDEDIDNINEDKILFKKFTTDDDFSAMKKSGGIITTAGGELSHAAIKATELDKPSLILNKTEWKTEIKTDEHGNKYSQKYLDVTYYKPTGETEIKNINGTDTEMQKIQKDTVEIRQGDKILMSTENGFIVKLSDENSEIQCSEIDKYSEKLKQKRKNIWKQEIIKELGIITEIASKQVAEILLFDVREKMMDTTLPLTEQDRKYIEKEMKQTKNKIYENISEQDYSDENKEETDNFTKEKDILSLNDIKANQKNMFGGKTVELAKIIEELKEFKEYNVIVTEGIGLSKNVTDQYCGGKLKELNSKLKELIKENKKYKKEQNEKELKKNEKEINKVRNEIKELIENSNNKEIEQYILENIDRNKYYAVRSSGIGEDGREYSFAGMGKSILNVKGSENVINAVKAVWKSFYDEEAIEYMLNTGQFIQPAVLIDEMVEDPDSAGVAVSRNENHNLLINAAKGLGDKVVDGTVTPDTIEVDTITGETIEYKSDIGRILTQEQVKQLNETIMFLEDKAGFPIDVEFAFKGDKLYILQRRAYTKFSMAEQVKQKIHPNIKFDKINKDVKELFFIEHENNAVPVYISFDKETKQITFVLDEQYQHFDSERILKKIINRVNEDFVARAKVNRNLPIFSNVIAGQLEFLPFVPVNNFEINDEDFDELKNSKNVINILGAA